MDTTTLLVVAVGCGVIAVLIGRNHGWKPVEAFLMGALLNLIGIAIVAMFPQNRGIRK